MMMMMMMEGGASRLCVRVLLTVPQQRSTLLIHPPGLDSLDQREEVLLTVRNRSEHVIQVWEGTPLVLHPVRLQTERQVRAVLHYPVPDDEISVDPGPSLTSRTVATY